jgi:hypothetical protein
MRRFALRWQEPLRNECAFDLEGLVTFDDGSVALVATAHPGWPICRQELV